MIPASSFDPAAATAAYLAQLPPEAHARAQAYTQGGHWLLLFGALAAVAAAWLVLRSGLLVRLRSRINRPWLAVLAVVAVDLLAEGLLLTPWDIYEDWARERSYGLSDQPLVGWLTEHAIGLAVSIVITLLLASGLYALARRAPRTWWAWSGGLTAVFVVLLMVAAPVFIQPLFNTYRPAPPGPVREAVERLARENGVPADKIVIYDGSRQSNRYTANVSGLFGTARIAMSDVMFAKGADLGEVRAVVGHEMGHYVQHHVLWMAGGYGLLAIFALWLVDRLFPLVLRLTGARGVEGLADPAGFPAVGIIVTLMALAATPLTNSMTRIGEAAADRFSLERAREPDGLARALMKTVEYRYATPGNLEEAIFYSHPSVGARIRRAMDWKAAHQVR
ncbi:M48 family metalloprotease [Phenylobacterium sp.]|uniref:M48 family metalloprotease n=1 Tax=Phenylobacterium sp. TaxID=1871053 RepID=UPI00273721B2|nr:M48 family metalloprotease [Phenylobacterium sp.]MDP3658924.1 M48 family metalloprotease [Phenylobacterium sp.]